MYSVEIIGLKKGTVKLVPHNVEWHKIAADSIIELKTILQEIVVDVQHIGSTSINNISAKPIIDMVVGLENKHQILDKNILYKLEQNGYMRNTEHDNVGKIFFYKGYDDIVTHHVHVVDYGEHAWNCYVGLRDYLNSNFEATLQYQEIKLRAEIECGNDIDKYHKFKAGLLKELNLLAGK